MGLSIWLHVPGGQKLEDTGRDEFRESEPDRKKNSNVEEVGRGSSRWPRAGETEATFWDPHPVPHFPKGQEPPAPYPGLLASFPINRWPAQPSHPRLTAPAQPSPWQGAPRLDPYPFMPCGPSPRVKGRKEDEGIPLAKWLESPLPAMQGRETERHNDAETQIPGACDGGGGRDRMVQMQREKQRETGKDRVTGEREVTEEERYKRDSEA